MSRWLALAKSEEENTQALPDSMTKPDKTSLAQPEGAFCQVLSNCQVDVQENPTISDAAEMRHGFAINGHPKTWTGKIVSLEAWRHLSEWDRHGQNGRMWNGITKQWEKQK